MSTTPGEEHEGITDSACSKSVVGRSWYLTFRKALNEIGAKTKEVPEEEHFKLGASRTFTTSEAAIFPVGIGNKAVILRVSIVEGDVPLLISRPALVQLGMSLDMTKNTADFKQLGLTGYRLGHSAYGHPTVKLLDWPKGQVKLDTSLFADTVEEVRFVRAYMSCCHSVLHSQSGVEHVDPMKKSVVSVGDQLCDTFCEFSVDDLDATTQDKSQTKHRTEEPDQQAHKQDHHIGLFL